MDKIYDVSNISQLLVLIHTVDENFSVLKNYLLKTAPVHGTAKGSGIYNSRDREPMAREPDVALWMTASGSLDIFLTRLLQMKMLYRRGRSLKRRGKSSSLHLKKNFLLGGCGFFVSDVISGRL